MGESASADAARGKGAPSAGAPSAVSVLKSSWPIALAVAFNRCSAIYGSYGSYAGTDNGLATDGGTLMGLVVLLVPFIAIGLGKLSLDERQSDRLLRACIALQALCLAGITACHCLAGASDVLHLPLHALNGILEVLVCGCWLSKLRSAPTSVVLLTLFSALAVSEVLFWPGYFLDDTGDGAVAIVITLLQLPLVGTAAGRLEHLDRTAPLREIDRPWSERALVNKGRFLVVSGVSLGLISMVIGFLRGFPQGEPITLDLPSRTGYFVSVLVLCLVCCVYGLRRRREETIAGMWIMVQALICVAMILYAALPGYLGVGAAATTVLNALCVVYIWILTVEFMDYGNKDPLYYAIGGRIVFMGGRAIARMTEGFLALVLGMTPLLMFAVSAALLVVSTTILTYVFFMSGARRESKAEEGQMAPVPHPLRTIMGVDIDDESTLSDMREATMRRQVEQIGRQFLLSGREVEVLTLYALGFKQQSVAEQLGISPGTVHAHIKRIYSKTDMHSRQDVLDYIDKYCT